MIQANELRIGNFVRYKDYPNDLNEIRGVCKDRVHPIELIEHDNNAIYAHQCILSDLDPIPLTPEILLKCGFVKIDMCEAGDYIGISICKREKLSINLNNNTLWIGEYDTKVKYLHQLQNLYFALTGEELQISL